MMFTPQILIGLLCVCIYLFFRRQKKGYATPLTGPPSQSIIFGVSRYLNFPQVDSGEVFERWAKEYGSVYKIPNVLGGTKIIVCDPRAVKDFYTKETWTYVRTSLSKKLIETSFGRGLLWAEGESHKRQRKGLTPAFSNAAIRRLTSVFYDSAYKLKSHWDADLSNHPDGLVIDVQTWMNHISIDSVGIAGFSHDFGALDGKHPAVVAAFESLGSATPSSFSTIVFLLSLVFPILTNIPRERTRLFAQLTKSMTEIADVLLERTRKAGAEEKSIIGLLIKAESTNGELHMSQEEVLAQNVLLLAGYETTSTSLTWALIELAKNSEKQDRLRKELLGLAGGSDPTWDQLTGTDYPYLDAVVHETLRLHPPVAETSRTATQDDILPLSSPLTTADGQIVNSVAIPKGSNVSVPIRCINRAEAIWGPRAKEFLPERWIGFSEDESKHAGDFKIDWQKGAEAGEGIPPTVQEIHGHKHLLTFSDGPRTCLGKAFALAEFKAVLSVLIRNYSFSFDDPNTKVITQLAVLPRPKVEGCDGTQVPMRVRRVE
ncbi:cytochrome p450 [Moniliophthora roreri MCA 2997]|uniref:Cytochrome p450 n=1 Tax=Moniliophthora roreri (strain MCA 2997) TaxID=1381753 RepID=V2XE58_MONRO|nr:cytochrome p450 [Moniliophthora roreri MCA 2997]